MEQSNIRQDQETTRNQTPATWVVSHPLPTGTVTFLFTDIVGSTPLWESQPEQMAEALQIHNTTLREAIEANGGAVFKTVGDAFQAAFPTALEGLKAAIEGQRALQNAQWNELGSLKVRMGLHTGEATLDPGGDEYTVSHTKNRIGRIHSIAYGGQILLSSETCELVDHQLPPGVTLNDLGEHHLKGLLFPEHLYQVNAMGLPDEFPPLATALAHPNNLPVELTSFIGREQEIREVSALLRENRLVTLTGVGGTGKTRLALQVSGLVVDNYPHGVWLAELAPLTDPALVPQTVAAAFRLLEIQGISTDDKLVDFLRPKHLLLVLDNCEHLLETCTRLSDRLLSVCPELSILATSREILGVRGEILYHVPPMALPEADHLPPLEQLGEYDAVRLFVTRAQMVAPGFDLTSENATTVLQIVKRLDGIPLAIELAAARLRLLNVMQIARRLDDAFSLLTGGSRTVLPHHQTLRASIEWSYDLLSDAERLLLHRISVFAGDWKLEAAEVVCADPPGEAAAILPNQILDLLYRLLDKSFLRRVDEDHLGMHELMKQYANEKLRAKPEDWSATRLRHCRYFASLITGQMRAPDASSNLEEVESAFDDIQAAWRYAVENKYSAEIQQFAQGFLVYYRLHSWYRAGSGALALYQQALAVFDPDTTIPEHRSTIACLYESLGDLHELATSHESALVAFEKALEYTTSSNYIQRSRLYGYLADTRVAMNQHEKGHELYTQAESVLEETSQRDADWWAEWIRLHLQRMELYYWQNLPEDMARISKQIGTQIEQHGSLIQRMRYQSLMGYMALRRDSYFNSDEAIAYSSDALALSLKSGNLSDMAWAYFEYGFCHLWSDNLAEAEIQLQTVREMTEESGDLAQLTRALTYLSVLYRKQGDIERVREYTSYLLRTADEAKMRQYIGVAYAQLAWLAWCKGDLAEARTQAEAAIATWHNTIIQEGYPFYWLALFPLIGVTLQEADVEQAVECVKHMLIPLQQRLPDDLTELLARAIAVWEQGQASDAEDFLHKAFQKAQAYHYV